jgi:hypothetical protein
MKRRARTNRFDGGCAPPNPAPLRPRQAVRGELHQSFACGKRRAKKAYAPKLFPCMTTCPFICGLKKSPFDPRWGAPVRAKAQKMPEDSVEMPSKNLNVPLFALSILFE